MSRQIAHSFIGRVVESKAIGAKGRFIGTVTEALVCVTAKGPSTYFIVEDHADGTGWHRTIAELYVETIQREKAA